MPLALTPRMFIGLLGVAAAFAGLIALLTGVTASTTEALFGYQTVGCGNTFLPKHEYGGDVAAACEKALDTRRTWGWPLLIVGGIAVAGAMLVRSAAGAPIADTGDEGADTSM